MKLRHLFILTLSLASFAQTISPPHEEHSARHNVAKGSFTVSNNSLLPEVVTITPYNFRLVNGKAQTSSPDESVNVKTSVTSVTVGPQSSEVIDFEIRCAVLPCAVAFDAAFTDTRHTDNGLKMVSHLLAIEYVCEKEKNCRDHFMKAWQVK